MADVLLFNLRTTSVGTENGSGYSFLRVILQTHVAKFEKDIGKKKLVFVLRDFFPQEHNAYPASLQKDLDSIWTGITKPKEFEKSPISDFFDIEIIPLPYPYVNEAQF
jgi:hypothetical protein